MNSVCGVIEPGLHSTWPRSISVRAMPRSSTPMLSPACAWSSSLRNISTPVTTVLRGLGVDADDLDLVADLDHAALDTAGGDGAAAGDGEDVLDGHQERLVDVALRLGDEGVDRVHELVRSTCISQSLASSALERLERRAA